MSLCQPVIGKLGQGSIWKDQQLLITVSMQLEWSK